MPLASRPLVVSCPANSSNVHAPTSSCAVGPPASLACDERADEVVARRAGDVASIKSPK